MAAPLETLANVFGHARFHHHVRTWERQLHEARRLERLLDVQAMVNDVRDDLHVGLRLIPPAHHAEPGAEVTALHERRNHCLQRTLARREHVGV